jgi:hypothetical protein
MLRESKREGREPDEQGEEGDEEKGGVEKVRLLHGGRIEGVKPASSQYTPMQGLEIVRIALAALLTLPFLGGFTVGVYFCASFAHVGHGHVGCAEGQVVSGAGLLVLFVNLAPYCVILNAAQCLLSLNPDLINAESQQKRLHLEVQRLEEERAINCGGRRLPSLLQGLDEKRNDLLRAERLLKLQMEVYPYSNGLICVPSLIRTWVRSAASLLVSGGRLELLAIALLAHRVSQARNHQARSAALDHHSVGFVVPVFRAWLVRL